MASLCNVTSRNRCPWLRRRLKDLQIHAAPKPSPRETCKQAVALQHALSEKPEGVKGQRDTEDGHSVVRFIRYI